MPERPKLTEALEKILALNYPATTISIAPERASGHRLARAITAKSAQPSRPFALVDGLAVIAADVMSHGASPEPDTEQLADGSPVSASAEAGSEAGGEVADSVAAELTPDQVPADEPLTPGLAELSPAEVAEIEAQFGDEAGGRPSLAADPVGPRRGGAGLPASATGGPPAPPPSPAETRALQDSQAGAPASPVVPPVVLTLRSFPQSNRREDALQSGQAIAVPVGGEVPRGADFVYPFAALPEGEIEPEAGEPRFAAPKADDTLVADPEDDELPVAEPPRDWDKPTAHQRGTLELPRLALAPGATMVPIGAWARNRDILLPERTILRASELALLQALGVDEVEVFRRPVVGVASLGLPFPEAGHPGEKPTRAGVCPLLWLTVNMMRAARVAALPLGFAPLRFRELLRCVQRWVSQVDILVLVGGSHDGPRCLGHDVLSSIGDVTLEGLDITPGGDSSVGRISERLVAVLPGSLPDVLTGFVLLVRPMAHKHLTPHLFSGTLPLELENGSRLRVERDTAVAVRYGYDRERAAYTTRYSGRQQDPWLDYVRGQALLVLEAGRQYRDGDVVTAHAY